MSFLYYFFGLILTISFFALVLGMINPELVYTYGNVRTRWRVLLTYLPIVVICSYIISPIEPIIDSREQFIEGTKYYQAGNYEKAFAAFRQVVPEDKKNYSNAQKMIKKITIEWSNELLNEAKTLHEQGQFVKAYSKLQESIEVNPSNTAAVALKDNYKKDSKEQIYQQEKVLFDKVLEEARNSDIEEAINILEGYLKESHPNEFLVLTNKQLQDYKAEYEKIKSERMVENTVGVRVVSLDSEWNWYGLYGDKLLVPQVRMEIKNVSNRSLNYIVVKASFVDIDKNEVLGEGTDIVIGPGDVALEPGYTKTAFLRCDTGYKNDMIALNFPNIVAKIYINNIFCKEVKINKRYAGMTWE